MSRFFESSERKENVYFVLSMRFEIVGFVTKSFKVFNQRQKWLWHIRIIFDETKRNQFKMIIVLFPLINDFFCLFYHSLSILQIYWSETVVWIKKNCLHTLSVWQQLEQMSSRYLCRPKTYFFPNLRTILKLKLSAKMIYSAFCLNSTFSRVNK